MRLLLAFLFLFSLGCPSQQDEVQRMNNTAVIFIDKSQSLEEFPDNIKKLYEKNVNDIVSKHIRQEGDEIIVSYIHSQTASQANRFRFMYEPPTLDTEDMTSLEIESAKEDHALDYIQAIKSLGQKVQKSIFGFQADASSSHILESIKVLDDELSRDKNRDYFVYYFSDMKEFSSIRKMNLQSGNTNQKERKADASKDTKKLTDLYGLRPDCLAVCKEIKIILPAVEMNQDAAYNNIVPPYWEQVFASYKGPKPEFTR